MNRYEMSVWTVQHKFVVNILQLQKTTYRRVEPRECCWVLRTFPGVILLHASSKTTCWKVDTSLAMFFFLYSSCDIDSLTAICAVQVCFEHFTIPKYAQPTLMACKPKALSLS